jgi:hypothetical protein
VFLIAPFLCGCHTEKSQDINEWQLGITDKKIVLAIDSLTINHTKALQLYTDSANQEYLCYANVHKSKNQLLIFDLQKQTLSKRIDLATEGPHGVGSMSNFYLKDWATLYVTSYSTQFVGVVDEVGQLKHKINYSLTTQQEAVFPSITDYHNPILFEKDKILLPILPDGNWTYMSQADLDKKRICVQIDSKTKEVRYLPLTFPKDYWVEGKKDPIFSRVKAADNYVYSFLGDNHLYVTKDHKKTEKYFAGSAFFQKVAPHPKNMNQVEDYIRFMSQNAYYDYLMYDAYREVFYRFVSLGAELKPNDNIEQIAAYPPQVSIIIIDKNFKKIGETKLPPSRFLVSNAFVSKDGLYISENHPANPQSQDNYLIFNLLTLERK